MSVQIIVMPRKKRLEKFDQEQLSKKTNSE